MPSKVSEALGQFALTLRPASPFIFEFLGTLYVLGLARSISNDASCPYALAPCVWVWVCGAATSP